jgi:hypothetical protein
MNKKRTRILTLIALAGLHGAGISNGAQVIAPAAGDIFLGVRASDGQGSGTSYIVNLGNDATFRNAAAGTTLALGDVGADLVAIFGPDWHTRNNLFWGIFGTRNQTNPVTYASRQQLPFGSSATGFAAQNLAARSSTNSQLISVIAAYSSLQATANLPKAAVQTNAPNSGSYNFQVGTSGTSDFGSISNWTSIEGNFANGARRAALDLFRYSGNPSTSVDSVERLGSLSITSAGVLSFRAGPVLEQVQVSFETISVDEDDGTATVQFERFGDTLSSAATATFAVSDGTAVSGTDFTLPSSFAVNFAPGQSQASVGIAIANRTGYHGNRSFSVTLQSATGGFAVGSPATSVVAIGELDPDPGALAFSGATFNTTVSATTVSIGLVRTAGSAGQVAVDVSVSGGTLSPGTQFTFSSPTQVTFADGATTASTTITLSTIVSGTIVLQLSNPTNFARLGTQTAATVNVAGIPGTLSFGAGFYSFPEGAGSVNIPVVRTLGLQGTVTVQVSAVAGSASAADFTLAPAPFTATLANGQSSVNVPLSILADAVSETNETFTLTLSNPGGGALLGALTSTSIRINEFDTVIPTVAVTAPVAAARLTASPLQVTGTYADDKGLDRVLVRLNGGPAAAATLAGNANRTSGAFNRQITPVPGANTVTVQAVDATGNVSTPISRSFTYVVTSPFTASIDPASPPNSGTLTPLLGTPLPGTLPNLEIGRSYTISARPAPGFLFAGWTGPGVSATAGELATLTFTHQANLSIVAKFVENPFKPEWIGEFNGLARAVFPNVPSLATEGFITVNVGSTGAFSGSLRIDESIVSLRGVLNTNGVARFGPNRTTSFLVARVGKPSLILSFQVDLNPTGTRQLTGAVAEQTRAGSAPRSEIVAGRASYRTGTPLSSARQGFYTFVLPSQAQSNGLTANDFPQGDGVGSVTVTANGLASFRGNLADGTPFTTSAWLSKLNGNVDRVPIFAQPYGTKGAIAGNISFDSTQTESDLLSASVLWFKPVLGGHYYPLGWLEGVTTALTGAKYASSAGASVIPGLPPVSPLNGNATLQFSDGKLAETLSKNVNISAANLVTKVPVTDPTYALSINPSKGDISGTFDHSDQSRPKFVGKIVQKGANGGAYGYFLTVAPKVPTGTGESGGVSLNHK